MERPSHSNLRSSHAFSSRLVSLGLAISLPALMAWAMAHGTVGEIIKTFGPLTMVPVADPVKPRTPPPEPKLEVIPQIKVIQPDIVIAPQQTDDRVMATTATATTGPALKTDTPPASGPDRALTAIVSTHTAPPYPALSQRLGEQGNVGLRLTVLADGTVGKAEIVNSSGSTRLDEAAQSWIVAHWKYKPALDKGQPAIGQTVVTVNFNLKDQR
jgi:protein TonB